MLFSIEHGFLLWVHSMRFFFWLVDGYYGDVTMNQLRSRYRIREKLIEQQVCKFQVAHFWTGMGKGVVSTLTGDSEVTAFTARLR